MEFIGTGASEGTVYGPAVIFRHELPSAENSSQVFSFNEAMEKFYNGRSALQGELVSMAREAEKKFGEDKASLFEAYAEILMDDEIEDSVKIHIKEGMAPGMAAQEALEEQVRELEALKGAYMRERGRDLADIGRRLAALISGGKLSSLPVLDKPSILVADELSPFETLSLNLDLILGLALDKGGYTGHTAILARSLGIPCVVGLGVSGQLRNGCLCALDGGRGSFVTEPDEETLKIFSRKEEARQKELISLAKNAGEQVSTSDGAAIIVYANIGSPEEARRAAAQGADGVGVFRTELMYMEGDRLPSEEEQFRSYREAQDTLAGKIITIRTLDIGGDKDHPALGLEKEDNPFLGYRALRLGLNRPEILKPQIRAILRAAYFGKVQIMFPLISSLDEIRKARSCVEECRKELLAEGLEAGNPPFGIMVETPAAVIMAREFAGESDYFSIGTNDLAQYTLAADRGNPRIASLYDQLNPAVLRLIDMTVKAASEAGIHVCLCGELAADLKALPLLIGLGLTELSVSSSWIPQIKAKIQSLDFKKCLVLAEKALALRTAAEVRNLS